MKIKIEFECRKPSKKIRSRTFEAESKTEAWMKIPEYLMGRKLLSVTEIVEEKILREDLSPEALAELEEW